MFLNTAGYRLTTLSNKIQFNILVKRVIISLSFNY